MIRERLQELTMQQLHRLADRYELDGASELARDELVEMVAEAIDEFRLEREAGNDHPVTVQEKKYECYIDAVLDGSDFRAVDNDDWELPEQYNETRIVLLLRDPSWAYCYWEVNEGNLAKLAENCGCTEDVPLDERDPEEEFDGLALRVHELPSMAAGSEEALYTFTIPVKFEDGSWYINLPHTGTFYRVSLIAHVDDCVQTLAVSNPVAVPAGDLAIPIGENQETTADKILSITNLEAMPVETYSDRMPQRIISLQDE